MDTREDLLAWHHTRLLGWLVERVAYGLLLGTVVALVVGGFAWHAGNVGWVVASPGVGLLVLGGFLAWFSPPTPPE